MNAFALRNASIIANFKPKLYLENYITLILVYLKPPMGIQKEKKSVKHFFLLADSITQSILYWNKWITINEDFLLGNVTPVPGQGQRQLFNGRQVLSLEQSCHDHLIKLRGLFPVVGTSEDGQLRFGSKMKDYKVIVFQSESCVRSECKLFSLLYSLLFNTVFKYKNSQMTGFKLQVSGVGSDRSTNWTSTTARIFFLSHQVFSFNALAEFHLEPRRLLEVDVEGLHDGGIQVVDVVGQKVGVVILADVPALHEFLIVMKMLTVYKYLVSKLSRCDFLLCSNASIFLASKIFFCRWDSNLSPFV